MKKDILIETFAKLHQTINFVIPAQAVIQHYQIFSRFPRIKYGAGSVKPGMTNKGVTQRSLINEEGSILIVALVLLVLLTLMGISATTLTNIELQIAGNEMTSRANFYRAEAASMENIQVLVNSGEAIKDPALFPWLNLPEDLHNPNDVTDPDNWTPANSQAAVNAEDDDQRYLTVFEGIIAGDSLDMTRSRVYTYSVVGKGERNNGSAFVEMGFRAPF
jgi:hypothetical protein